MIQAELTRGFPTGQMNHQPSVSCLFYHSFSSSAITFHHLYKYLASPNKNKCFPVACRVDPVFPLFYHIPSVSSHFFWRHNHHHWMALIHSNNQILGKKRCVFNPPPLFVITVIILSIINYHIFRPMRTLCLVPDLYMQQVFVPYCIFPFLLFFLGQKFSFFIDFPLAPFQFFFSSVGQMLCFTKKNPFSFSVILNLLNLYNQ